MHFRGHQKFWFSCWLLAGVRNVCEFKWKDWWCPKSQCSDHEWKYQCMPSLVLGPQEAPRARRTVVALWGLWSNYLCQGRFRKHLKTPVSHIFPFLSPPNSQGERYKPANLPLAHWVPLEQMTQKPFHIWPCAKPVHWTRILLLNKSQTCSIPRDKKKLLDTDSFDYEMKAVYPTRKMLLRVLLKV